LLLFGQFFYLFSAIIFFLPLFSGLSEIFVVTKLKHFHSAKYF